MSNKNQLKGGKGDNLKSSNVNQKELAKGIKVEMEHTNDKNLAKEIALDHLAENPNYYSLLSKIHTEGKRLTKEEFKIKFLIEKIEKLSGKKVVLEDLDRYEQFLLDKKKKAAEDKQALVQNALANGAVPIEKLKKGDIFTFPGKDREYYFDGFNRHSGKYSFYRADDINHFGEKKKGTLVMVESVKKKIIKESTNIENDSDYQNLTDISKFVVNHFLNKKLALSRWERDEKLDKKLEGIQSAVAAGFLRVKNIPKSPLVDVSATNKLSDYYRF